MSKKRFYNRLEELFSAEDSVSPEPEPEARRRLEFLADLEDMEHPGYVYQDGQLHSLTEIHLNGSDLASHTVPLQVDGISLGSLVLEGESAQRWANEDAALIAAVAGQLAEQIKHLSQAGEAKDDEQSHARTARLEAALLVSAELSSILNPDALLATAVDRLQVDLNLYHVQIYLADEELNGLTLAAASGEDSAKWVDEGHTFPLTANGAPLALSEHADNPMWIHDVLRMVKIAQRPMLPETGDELLLPMMSGKQFLGMLVVYVHSSAHFAAEDHRLFAGLAAQLASLLLRARHDAALRGVVERLREMDRLKSDFLANISHELRTPLNSILGFTDVMRLGLDGALTEKMENDLKLIDRNGKHLLNLINNLLDMSKIEAGRMSLHLERFALEGILQEALDIVSPMAREKGLYVKTTVESPAPFELLADRMRFRQVLVNILGNAVRFTEQGGISVLVRQKDDKAVRIEVSDTGVGIPADKLPMLFEAFSQVDVSTTRHTGGTGLGLAICRQLVAMHGGCLWAESSGVPGEGSTFFIDWPFEAAFELH